MNDEHIINSNTLVDVPITKTNDYFSQGDLLFWKCEYQKAKEYFETILNPSSMTPIELSRCYNSLAATNAKLQNYEEAVTNYNNQLSTLLKLETSENVSTNIVKCYTSIGKVHCLRKDYMKAITYYEKALERVSTVNSVSDLVGDIYKDVANIYTKTQDFVLAEKYFRKALKINDQLLRTNHPKQGQTYANMGAMHLQKKDYEEALKYFSKARDIWVKSLSPNHIYLESMKKTIESVNSKLSMPYGVPSRAKSAQMNWLQNEPEPGWGREVTIRKNLNRSAPPGRNIKSVQSQ